MSVPGAHNSVSAWRRQAALHVVLFSAILLGESQFWAVRRPSFTAAHGRLTLYVVIAMSEFAEVRYVLLSLRRLQIPACEVIGPLRGRVRSIARDAVIAAVFWVAAAVVLSATESALDISDEETQRTIAYLLPRSAPEMAGFLALSVVAGVCEEIMFRGYLQSVIARVSGYHVIGVVAQAVLYGLAHGYQGVKRMSLVAVEGLTYGILTTITKRLRPAMMSHVFGDALAGAARILVPE